MLNTTRRQFLRNTGLGVGSVALSPILQQLQARAEGKIQNNLRFVFVVESNGLPPEQLSPEGVERKRRRQEPLNGPSEFFETSLKDRKLPSSIEPIAKWKDKLTILQGLSGRVAGGGHSNNYQALGAFGAGRGQSGESTAILGPTIDGALAKHWGITQGDQHLHAVLGLWTKRPSTAGITLGIEPDNGDTAGGCCLRHQKRSLLPFKALLQQGF